MSHKKILISQSLGDLFYEVTNYNSYIPQITYSPQEKLILILHIHHFNPQSPHTNIKIIKNYNTYNFICQIIK